MPKGFSEREKELIRKKLFAEGSKLFDKYGIQKTTVDEIAKAAGISKGSFYQFYPSKEELFFDILESLDKENKEKLSGDLFPADRSYRESFEKFLNGILESIKNASLMNKLNPAELEHLMRKLPEEKLAGHLRSDNSYFEEFYKNWKAKGVFRNVDPKGFTGIIKLFFYFFLHQADFAGDEFLLTKDLLIAMLCEYLVNE
jgi:AcrR family transcriptional regulator